MKTTFKVAFIIVALAVFLPAVSVSAQYSYVGASVGTTYTYHIVVGDSTACFAWTMHVDNITADTQNYYPGADVGVTITSAYSLFSGSDHEEIYVPADSSITDIVDQSNSTALFQYIVNKDIVNKTFFEPLAGVEYYKVDHDSNGVMTDWIWAYVNNTVIEAFYSGAGTGCTGLGGTGLGITPGYDFMIVGALTLLGVAILAIRLKRKY